MQQQVWLSHLWDVFLLTNWDTNWVSTYNVTQFVRKFLNSFLFISLLYVLIAFNTPLFNIFMLFTFVTSLFYYIISTYGNVIMLFNKPSLHIHDSTNQPCAQKLCSIQVNTYAHVTYRAPNTVITVTISRANISEGRCSLSCSRFIW